MGQTTSSNSRATNSTEAFNFNISLNIPQGVIREYFNGQAQVERARVEINERTRPRYEVTPTYTNSRLRNDYANSMSNGTSLRTFNTCPLRGNRTGNSTCPFNNNTVPSDFVPVNMENGGCVWVNPEIFGDALNIPRVSQDSYQCEERSEYNEPENLENSKTSGATTLDFGNLIQTVLSSILDTKSNSQQSSNEEENLFPTLENCSCTPEMFPTVQFHGNPETWWDEVQELTPDLISPDIKFFRSENTDGVNFVMYHSSHGNACTCEGKQTTDNILNFITEHYKGTSDHKNCFRFVDGKTEVVKNEKTPPVNTSTSDFLQNILSTLIPAVTDSLKSGKINLENPTKSDTLYEILKLASTTAIQLKSEKENTESANTSTQTDAKSSNTNTQTSQVVWPLIECQYPYTIPKWWNELKKWCREEGRNFRLRGQKNPKLLAPIIRYVRVTTEQKVDHPSVEVSYTGDIDDNLANVFMFIKENYSLYPEQNVSMEDFGKVATSHIEADDFAVNLIAMLFGSKLANLAQKEGSLKVRFDSEEPEYPEDQISSTTETCISPETYDESCNSEESYDDMPDLEIEQPE